MSRRAANPFYDVGEGRLNLRMLLRDPVIVDSVWVFLPDANYPHVSYIFDREVDDVGTSEAAQWIS